MKPAVFRILIAVALAASAIRLHARWREEQSDHRVSILVDWNELRDFASREGLSDADLLQRVQTAGGTGTLLSPLTLTDIFLQHRLTALSSTPNMLDATALRFTDPLLAAQVHLELVRRGVPDLDINHTESAVLRRHHGSFLALKDIEVGFDPAVVAQLHDKGMAVALRVNQDPWMSLPSVVEMLSGTFASDLIWQQTNAIVMNTDDLPGGADALPVWRAWVRQRAPLQLFFEFHPSKAAFVLGKATPGSMVRAHAITSLEFKDLRPDEELLRWKRAVEERSCRVLLFHVSPNDSLDGFLLRMGNLRDLLIQHGWELTWPRRHENWTSGSRGSQLFFALAAFLTAIFAPLAGLQRVWSQKGPVRGALTEFLYLSLITTAGACVVAALAQNPETRLELTPFHGIKAAFLLAWFGSLGILYGWNDIWKWLQAFVRRLDVLIGLLFLAVLAFLVIRSGNASGAWKSAFEQSLRDHLETILVARPRFKEFAIGHPLMLLGLYGRRHWPRRGLGLDSRPLIFLGMIGQVSIINTFCHLHSPLRLAFIRTFNGVWLGALLGGLLIMSLSRVLLRTPHEK